MPVETLIRPAWPAPASVRCFMTTRAGGVSLPPFDSLNLGAHVGDDPVAVAANRAVLRAHLPAEPLWLNQVHGVSVVEAGQDSAGCEGDAAMTRVTGEVCAVMTADCLPVLLCDRAGTVVAAAHAGWRGLAAGVLEATLARMGVTSSEVLVWLGAAIGPAAFEVGAEVRAVFVAQHAQAATAFVPHGERFMADIYALARMRLAAAGVTAVYGGGLCTYTDAARFFSYRREGRTGRMASVIWLDR
jgi:polyphenol oxidase